jgi:hypothetical protein
VRAVPGFAATMNVTVPLPLPDVALLMVIHGALLVAVQAHPAGGSDRDTAHTSGGIDVLRGGSNRVRARRRRSRLRHGEGLDRRW